MHEIVTPESLPPATTGLAPEPRRCRLRFTGTGEEYFGIWIVNLLLTVVTLGIYSAWAKVRKMQYFYRNTQLDGSAFEYHGNPAAILKGRLIAVALLVAYKLSLTLLGAFAGIAVLALMAAVPWLLTQSYRFRLRNSSYRGLRFRFEGPAWQAYLIFGVPMLLLLAPGVLIQGGIGGDPHHPDRRLLTSMTACYVMLALIWPFLHFSFKRWQHGHARYGSGRGRFVARPGDFYAAYIVAALGVLAFGLLPMVLLLLGIGLSAGSGHINPGIPFVLALIAGVAFYAGVLMAGSVVAAWVQNAVWSGTRFESVGFSSQMRAGRLMGITFGNIVMVVFSLGLLIPFASMRLMKYKIESIEVLDADALSRFVGEGQGEEVGATGEGAVDVMDLDFGL